jgi:Cys-rich four helix bundle protein (predicted Tat secretion target)
MAPRAKTEIATTLASDEQPSRRALLAAGTGLAAALYSAAAARAEDAPDAAQMDHSKMDHSAMDHSAMGHGSADAKFQKLIDAAHHCGNKGEVCLDHCIALLSKGDTSLKDCIRSISVMLPMCQTLSRLAALDAKRLKEFVKVCAGVCADCEAECKKHAEHHAICKACQESCAACIKECKVVLDG